MHTVRARSMLLVLVLTSGVLRAQPGRPEMRHRPPAVPELPGLHWYDLQGLGLSNRWAINVFPSNLMDEIQGSLNLGAEYFFNRRFGVEVSAGMGASFLHPLPRTAAQKNLHDMHRDFRIAVEPRLYWNNMKKSRAYFGLTGFYRRRELDVGRYDYRTSQNVYLEFDGGHLKQDMAGVVAMFGRQHLIARRFLLEIDIGLGYATFSNYWSKVQHKHRSTFYNDYSYLLGLGTVSTSTRLERGGSGLCMPFTLKLGVLTRRFH